MRDKNVIRVPFLFFFTAFHIVWVELSHVLCIDVINSPRGQLQVTLNRRSLSSRTLGDKNRVVFDQKSTHLKMQEM